mmetsp:Transcript_42100/g.98164  ORF Transcript_42100/g.98164 Transcript_42100/m.98164 type:complete len:1131 (+) Transcript_42100:43-3435(+)
MILRYVVAVVAALPWLAGGQDLRENTGLLAEYFAPTIAAELCDPLNGSTQVLKSRLPNIARRVTSLEFDIRDRFDLDRCAWEEDFAGENLQFNCRGQEELRENFAARYTGYVYVFLRGYYTFQIEADDGFRMILGHDACPGEGCATRYDVQNWAMQGMRKNREEDGSYGNQCSQCAQGIYDECFVTIYGCEPFSLWQLEGDGGLSGTCETGEVIRQSTRWLESGMHPLRLEYFQRGGDAKLFFRYSGPDTQEAMIPVPREKLGFPRVRGLTKEVFDVSQEDPAYLPPVTNLGAGYANAQLLYLTDDRFQLTGPGEGDFSVEIELMDKPVYVRWQGFFLIESAGEYIFRVVSDDGGRLTLGGRGYGGETMVVEIDGLQDRAGSQDRRIYMLAGLHPVRIEFFWKPQANPVAVARPPGIQVTYSGFDTGGYYYSIARDSAGRLTQNEYDCELRRFAWGNGMSVSRDCEGTCFVGSENIVGDVVCDNGEAAPSYNVACEHYYFDNYDCSPTYPVQLQTTPRPSITCLQSCPSGNFRRKNCGCASASSMYGGVCVETHDDYCPSGIREDCTFVTCCVAEVTGLNYWGKDCLAFGTSTNCTGKLNTILTQIQESPLALDAASTYDPLVPRPPPTGRLTTECFQSNCNQITDAYIVNQFTGFQTDQRVCPVEESPDPGYECFIGPFGKTGVTNVLTQCQDARFQWNFCLDRKTHDGRPHRACCSFLYLNARGNIECQMMGVAQGTCTSLLQELTRNLSTSTYTMITNGQVLKECSTDRCNNPDDEVAGCPAIVNKEPAITEGLRTTKEPTLEQLLEGSSNPPPEPPPWGLIGGLASIPFAMVCIAMALNKAGVFREAIEPLFHTSKATVVAEDTFIEPQRDLMLSGTKLDQNLTYGRVEPRPMGLKDQLGKDKVLPLALTQRPDTAVPEAANAAWVDSIVHEAQIQQVQPHEIHPLPDVLNGTTYTGEGAICLPEELDMPFTEKQALALQQSEDYPRYSKSQSREDASTSQHQAVSASGLSSRLGHGPSRTASKRTGSKLGTSRTVTSGYTGSHTDLVTVTERPLSQGSSATDDDILDQGMLPEPPSVAPVPEMGHVEGSVSGLVLSPVSVGNLHRPAAAAKMLRNQSAGVPRVAT